MSAPSELVIVYHSPASWWRRYLDRILLFSVPKKISCPLTRLTQTPAGPRKEWISMLERTGHRIQHCSRSRFRLRYGFLLPELPAIYLRKGREWKVLVSHSEIHAASDIHELSRIIRENLSRVVWVDSFPFS